jgi:hypothetical protein
MAAAATAGPLQNDVDGRIGGGDLAHRLNGGNRARLERHVLDAGGGQLRENVARQLERRHAGRHAHAVDRQAVARQLAHQRILKAPQLRRQEHQIEADAVARLEARQQRVDFGAEHGVARQPAARQLAVVAGVQHGGNELVVDSGRRHAGHHQRRAPDEARELGVDEQLAVALPLHETRREAADPRLRKRHRVEAVVVQRRLGAARRRCARLEEAGEQHLLAGALVDAVKQHAGVAHAARTKVDHVRHAGVARQRRRGRRPVERAAQHQAEQRADQRVAALGAQVATVVGRQHGAAQRRALDRNADARRVALELRRRVLQALLRVKRHRRHDVLLAKETLAARVRHARLIGRRAVGARRRQLGAPQQRGERVQTLRMADDDKRRRRIGERHLDHTIGALAEHCRVDGVDVAVDVRAAETAHNEHRRRIAVAGDARLAQQIAAAPRQTRRHAAAELRAHASAEQQRRHALGAIGERRERRAARECGGGEQALRVTGGGTQRGVQSLERDRPGVKRDNELRHLHNIDHCH